MAAGKNPLWLILILSFLFVYCGVYFNLTPEDWDTIFDAASGRKEFLYAATPSGIKAFAIDATTGNLTEVPGSPFGSTCCMRMDAVRNDGSMLWISEWDLSTFHIQGRGINSDGTLTAAVNNAAASGATAAITLDASESYAFVTDRGGTSQFSIYTVNRNTLELTLRTTSSIDGTSNQVSKVEVTPDSRYLYAISNGSYIFQYTFDPSTGTVLGSTNHPLGNMNYLVMDLSARGVYTAPMSASLTNIYYFPLDAGNGSMYSPYSYTAGLGDGNFGAGCYAVNGMCQDAAGQYLFVSISYSSIYGISRFTLNPDGSLDPGSEKIFGTMNYSHDPVVNSTNRFLYIPGNELGSNFIQIYKIENGELLETDFSPYYIDKSAARLVIVSKRQN